jgi:hypothetical protein
MIEARQKSPPRSPSSLVDDWDQHSIQDHARTKYNKQDKMADQGQLVTLRTRKFIRNPLLGRKQMVM